MRWTDESVAALKRLWERGETITDIASILEFTFGEECGRSAVSGKIIRLRARGEIENRSCVNRGGRKPSPILFGKGRAGKNPKKAPAAKKPAEVKADPITLLFLTEGRCRWPIGEANGPDTLFCGEPSEIPRPYCPQHMRVAYQVPPPATNKSAQTRRRETGGNALVL